MDVPIYAIVHMGFLLPQATSKVMLPVLQHQITCLAEATFLHVNRMQTCPRATVL